MLWSRCCGRTHASSWRLRASSRPASDTDEDAGTQPLRRSHLCHHATPLVGRRPLTHITTSDIYCNCAPSERPASAPHPSGLRAAARLPPVDELQDTTLPISGGMVRVAVPVGEWRVPILYRDCAVGHAYVCHPDAICAICRHPPSACALSHAGLAAHAFSSRFDHRPQLALPFVPLRL